MSHAKSPRRLQWTLNRLRSMDAAEVAFRVRRKIQGTAERAGLGRARPMPPKGEIGRPWVTQMPRGFAPAAYTRAAERILAGVWDVFALEGTQLGFPQIGRA